QQHVEHGYKKKIQRRRSNHAAKYRRAHRLPANPPGPGSQHQRQNAKNKRQRSHQNRPQTNSRRLNGPLHNRMPALPQLLRKFHKQNRILAGKADQHHQPNLAIDIILQSAQRNSSKRPQQCHGHSKQYDERQRKTFILRRQREIDDQNPQAKKQRRSIARLELFFRTAAPLVAEAFRQTSFSDRIHRFNRIARTPPGRTRAVNFRRSKNIEVADDLRRGALLDMNPPLQRNNRAGSRAHVIFLQIVRRRAVLLVGLNVNAVSAIVEIEIVDVNRAHINLQRIGNLIQRHLQSFG